MPTVLLYPAGPAQEEAFLEARRMGLRVITIDQNENAHCIQHVEEFHKVNPGDLSAVARFLDCYDGTIDGALLVGADLPRTQAYITTRLGLAGVREEAAALTVNKYEMKRKMRAAGVNVPDFYKVSSGSEVESIFRDYGRKMVLKPNDNCGSRGLLQITGPVDFQESFDYARRNVKEGGVVLEKFEPGLQISIEGIVIENVLYTTGFADRNYDKLEDFFPLIMENGAAMPTVLSTDEASTVIREFEKAVAALGIHTGVVKGDMIFNNGQAFVIEVAARISGGKFASKLVPLSCGINLLHVALRQSLGMQIDTRSLVATKREGVAVRYFFPPKGILKEINGLAAVKRKGNYVELRTNYDIGDRIPQITSHTLRGGWVVCHAKDRDRAVEMAEEIVRSIDFVTEA